MPPLRNLPLPTRALQEAAFTSLSERMAKDLFVFDAETRKESDALSLERIGGLQLPEDGGVTGTTGYESMLGDTDLGETPQNPAETSTDDAETPQNPAETRTTGLMQPTLDMPAMSQPRRRAVYDPTQTIDIQGEPDYDPSADTGTVFSGPSVSSSSPGAAPPIAGKFPEEQARIYQQARASGLDDEGARVLVAVSETEGGARGAVGDNGRARGVFQFHDQGEFPSFAAWLRKQGIEGDPAALAVDPEISTRYAAEGYLGQAIKRGRELGYSGAELATYVQRTGQRSIRPETTGENYTRLFGQGVPSAPVAAPSTSQRASEGRNQAGETRLQGITPPQFGLGDADADAICGPVLAMAFAKANGRNPTIAEAKQMATQYGGWTSAQGMGGPDAMANTLRQMGTPASYKPGPLDIETIRRETQNGNPVGINTRGHYFVVESVDQDGRLDLGNSAKALKSSGGRQWFKPNEIEGLGMGAPTGAIYKDSPSSPVPSVAVTQTKMPTVSSTIQEDPTARRERDALALTADLPSADSPPSTPAGGPTPAGVSPLDDARSSTGGGPTMARQPIDVGVPVRDRWADEPVAPYDPDQGPRETGYTLPGPQPSSGPGSVGVAAGSEQTRPATAPDDPDQGPREAPPGSVGAQPIVSPMAPGPVIAPPINYDPDQGPREALPGSMGAGRAVYDSDSGAREAIPGSVGARPLTPPPVVPPPQYSGPSYAQPRVPAGQRPFMQPTEREAASMSAATQRATGAETWAERGLGALEVVSAASDYISGRFDPVAVPALTRTGILHTDLTPEQFARFQQLAIASNARDENGQQRPLTESEMDELDAFYQFAENKYQQIKNDPDELMRYYHEAPGSVILPILLGVVAAPIAGRAAAGAAARGATALGAGARGARAAGYVADVATQSAIDPTNLPFQPAADVLGQGVVTAARGIRAGIGAAGEAVQGAARGLAEEGARLRGPGSEIAQAAGAPSPRAARAAAAPSTQYPGVFGISGLEPNRPEVAGLRPRVIPPHVADELDFPVRNPTDPAVLRAIEAAGGTVDERGVTLNVIRNQGPEAHGGTATRGMPFYIAGPKGTPNPYASAAGAQTGGPVRIEGETRFRSPLILSDAPGGSNGFEEAARQLDIRKRGTAEEIQRAEENLASRQRYVERFPQSAGQDYVEVARRELDDLRNGGPVYNWDIDDAIRQARAAGPEGSPARAAALKDLVSKYGGDPDLIDDLLAVRGADASESAWAIKENIVAGNARRQQYDGVVTVQPKMPDPKDIDAHPAVKAVLAERFSINKRVGEIPREVDARGATLGLNAADVERSQDPVIVGLIDEYNRLDKRRFEIPQALEDAKTQAYKELSTGRITELADPREARNPTPASPTADLKAAYKRVKDAERAVLEIEDSHAGALSDETYVAHMRALTEQREANAALDALMNEADVPTGYELRPDIPRRGDVRASTIEENTAKLAAEKEWQEAQVTVRPHYQQYARETDGGSTETFEQWATRTGNQTALDADARARQASTAYRGSMTEPRYRTAPNAGAPTIAPGDQAPVTTGPGTLASFGRAANTEALNAGGGAFAGNVVSGDLTPDPNDQRTPEERIRDAVLHAGVGAAAAVGLRHGGRVARRLGAPEGGVAASFGHMPEPGAPNRAVAVGADPSKRYEFRYRVADLADLIPSHTAGGEPNPAFPRELQPRARERAASQMQIDQIARGLVPDALLDDVGRLDSGPMIVGADNIVESGNGRVLALNRASSRYPEQYDAYTAALRDRLPDYGLDESALAGVERPVLVRERVTDVDRAAFAAEANESGVLRMSSFEQATQDASNLSDVAVTNLTVGENDTIASALRRTDNRALVRQWVGTLPENERAMVIDANGDLSAQGYDRLTNAMLVKTYGQGAGERLARTFIESADPTVKNVQTALLQSLPDMARTEALIRSGQRDAGLSIAEDVATAAEMLARLRREGVRVSDYLAQGAMFERELTPLQESMLDFLGRSQRRPSAIRDALREYASRVENTADPNQGDMFGGMIDPPKKEDLWRGATAGSEVDVPDAPLFAALEENPPAGRVPADGAGLETPPATAIPESPPAPAAPRTADPAPLAPETPSTPVAPPAREMAARPRPPEAEAPPFEAPSAGTPPPPGSPPSGARPSTPPPRSGGPIRRSPPTVDDGSLPRGPRALPGPAGRTADDLIVAAHGAVGVPERASVLEPKQLERWRRNFVRAWTDNRVDLAEAQAEARRLLGRPLTGDEMMLELSRVNPTGAAKTSIDENLRPILTGLDSSKPVVTVTSSDGKTAAMTETQVLARMRELTNNRDVALVLENPDRKFPGGLTGAESEEAARALLEKLPRETQIKIGQANNQLTDVIDTYRERLVDAGVWSRELADDLKAKYPNWVPTKILDYMRDEGQPGAAGIKNIGLSNRHLQSYLFEGTSKMREDGIASTIRYIQQAEEDIAKNRTFNAFVRLRDQIPEWKDLIREVKSDTPVERMRGEAPVTGWVGGEKKRYIVPAPLSAAIQMEQGQRMPYIGAMTAGFRELITRSPAFVAGQIPLDFFSTLIRESAREGGPQYAPKVAAAIVGGYREAFRGLMDGTFKGDTAAYLREGGAMAGYYQRSAQSASKALDETSRKSMFEFRNADDVKKTLKWLATLEPVTAVGQRVELAPRTASFRLGRERAIQRGLAAGAESTDLVPTNQAGAKMQLPERTTKGVDERRANLEAMTGARDVSLDFQRGGTFSRVLNQIIPFFNVGVQSTATPWRSFKEAPKAYPATVVGLIGAPLLAAEAWNRSDPQRAQDYDDVPDYVKDRGIVLMTGSSWTDKNGERRPQYALIPTRELSPFVIMGRELSARAMDAVGVSPREQPRAWQEMLEGAVGAASPVQANNPGDLFSSANPVGLNTGAQLAMDQDTFRDRRIATDRGDREAGVVARGAAAMARGMSGLPFAGEHLANTRPSQTEFAIRDTTGNLGAAVLAGADLVASMTGTLPEGAEPKSLESTPVTASVTKRFVGDATGARLERAQSDENRIPDIVKEALDDAGMTGAQVTPVSSEYKGARLTREEQQMWQDATNTAIVREFAQIYRDEDWRTPATRGRAVQQAVMRAKDLAAERVLRGLNAREIERRKRAS